MAECPYHRYAPRDDDARMAWGVFKDDAHRLRLTPGGGVLGVEMERATRRLMASGVTGDEADMLLMGCERGLVAALSQREGHDDGAE